MEQNIKQREVMWMVGCIEIFDNGPSKAFEKMSSR